MRFPHAATRSPSFHSYLKVLERGGGGRLVARYRLHVLAGQKQGVVDEMELERRDGAPQFVAHFVQ